MVAPPAALYSDDVIAGILNRQGRNPAPGERLTAKKMGNPHRYRKIPRFQPRLRTRIWRRFTQRRKSSVSTLRRFHRWLADGFIVGEQIPPGAPWQIRFAHELLRSRIVEQAPPGYRPMPETTIKLGVLQQKTLLQSVTGGDLEAVLVRQGRHKGLRSKRSTIKQAFSKRCHHPGGHYEGGSKRALIDISFRYHRARSAPARTS